MSAPRRHDQRRRVPHNDRSGVPGSGLPAERRLLQSECTVAGVKFKDVYFPVIFALTVVLTILRCLLYMGLAAVFGLT